MLHLRSTLFEHAGDYFYSFVDNRLCVSGHERSAEETFSLYARRRDNRVDIDALIEHLLTEIQRIERFIGEDRHDRCRRLNDLHSG